MLWAAIFLLVVAGWDVGWYAAGISPMFPWQLKKQLAASPESLHVIDVRTAAEYRLFHIPGAVSRPSLLLRPDEINPVHPPKPVVVICMTGHRSPLVARRLRQQGVKQVYNLTWGMLGWKLVGGKTMTGRPTGG
jgi:rhodanese-related sulfurtransferase